MLLINKKQVDIREDQFNLQDAVFIMDFDFDCTSFVCTTKPGQAIGYTISNLIRQARNNSGKLLPEIINSILNSECIYVTVIDYSLSPERLITRKYELIEQYSTYTPLGHNSLLTERSSKLAKRLAFDLNRRVCARINGVTTDKRDGRGRPSTPIFQYNKIQGNSINPETTWYLEKEWPSLKAVIEANPKWNASNISWACKDIDRTAYGYKWSQQEVEQFNN